MTKSRSKIEMDFSKAISQAQELEEVAGKLSEKVLQDIDTLIKEEASCWMGDNSQLFIKRGETIRNNMLGIASDLYSVANNIRSTSEMVYNAEKAALLLGF